ncbi:MAG: caspase family protein, partial [Acidobacteria bacterium]|nr:caspase family protein [Acidobacteriota bacterium]
MMWLRLAVIGLLWASSLAAQDKEQSVGLVLSSDGARLVRVNSELALRAKAGDILFPGDSLQGEGGTVSFLFCPGKSSQTLSEDGEVVFEADKLRVKQGELVDQKEVAFCILPQLERTPSASQAHFRDTLTRSSDATEDESGTFESRFQELPASERDALSAELEPIDQALSEDENDQAARLARAAILQKYGLSVDAIEEYEKISGAWEDADWVRALVHEEAADLEPELAEDDGPGETFALLVGISEYQRLTEEQQLLFAHADAETFEQFLLSPRGGALPEKNIERLTDEEATTAAIRAAIESFLRARAGKNDTVILFLAAHGTVAKTPDGPQAFIITYDSDPQDLASTALPMSDIQALMRDQLSKVGRVLIYVDVCRAGMIGTIKSNTVNRNMEELFEEEGDLFGFLASRPKEYSIESARFGGGHGAFTYFLLRALNGDADDIEETGNGDGFVSVNEVIDYVRDKVREATRNKQHPTERVSFLDDLELADIEEEGILLADWTPAVTNEGSSRFLAAVTLPDPEGMSAPKRRRLQSTIGDIVLFEDALEAGRVLPVQAGT